MEECGDIVN